MRRWEKAVFLGMGNLVTGFYLDLRWNNELVAKGEWIKRGLCFFRYLKLPDENFRMNWP